ncbi:flippase [Halobacteriaceae archaeon GCM10025711]
MTDAKIVRGLKATFLARIVRVAANGALVVVLTRVFLDPDQYGLLFFAISVFGVALLFSDLGFAKSAARYVAEYKETDPRQVPHIIRTGLQVNLATILLVGAVFLVFGDRLAHLLGEPRSAHLLVLGAVYVAARSLNTFTTLLFQGFGRVEWSAVVGIASNLGKLAFVLGFVALGFGVFGAIVGYVVAYAVGAAVGLVALYRLFYATYDQADDAEDGLTGRVLRYSVPLTATKGAGVLDKRVDTILVGYFLNPAAVGFYTLGKQVADFVIAPASSLGFTISPLYSERKTNDGLERAARTYETALEYVLLLYVPAAIGIVAVAGPGVRLVFGSDYAGAIPVVQVFSVYVVLRAIDKITNDGLDYLGRARARAYAKSGTAGANFLLNLVLIPTLGVVGAAVATVVTYAAMVSINVYLIHQELAFSSGRLLRTGLQICGVSALMGVSLFFALPHVNGVVSLVGVVLLGVGVWAALSILSGLLDVRQVFSMFG